MESFLQMNSKYRVTQDVKAQVNFLQAVDLAAFKKDREKEKEDLLSRSKSKMDQEELAKWKAEVKMV